MNKILAIIVTRNNPVLLQNLISSLERNDAGVEYDLIIADNSSDDPKHLSLLNKLSSKYKIETCENDRAESTYDKVSSKYLDQYDYFFFMHDDTYAYKSNWLKVYIDRAQSDYFEPEIRNTHLIRYPIGRVSGCSQPWRDFKSCKGYPLSAAFLQVYLNQIQKNDTVWIFKYSDQERVLYTKKCLQECPMYSLNWWKQYEIKENERFEKVKKLLSEQLQYPDEGMGPKDKYPAGQAWCKLMLLTEFLNSVYPLINGFRTVGLEGDGHIEQIDGFDTPFGMNYIAHFGSPHVKKYFAKQLGCTAEDVHKKLYSNDLAFIMKCNKMIENYYK